MARPKKSKDITRVCLWCKKEFSFPEWKLKSSLRKYCGASCAMSYRNKYEFNPSKGRDLSGVNNPMFGRLKEKNPNWKGGIPNTRGGFLYA